MVGAEFFCIFCLYLSSNKSYLIPACAQMQGLSNLWNENYSHSAVSYTLDCAPTWSIYQPGLAFCLESHTPLECSLSSAHCQHQNTLFTQVHLATHGFCQDNLFSLFQQSSGWFSCTRITLSSFGHPLFTHPRPRLKILQILKLFLEYTWQRSLSQDEDPNTAHQVSFLLMLLFSNNEQNTIQKLRLVVNPAVP